MITGLLIYLFTWSLQNNRG